MIAQDERPSYRLVIAQGGFGRVTWSLVGLPGVVGIAPGDRAPDAARATIAAVLEVPADTFDLLT